MTLLDAGNAHVLALLFELADQRVITLANLSRKACRVDLSPEIEPPGRVLEMFADRQYTTTPSALSDLELDGYGYRWLRLS
jgi:hypothetical protein